MIMNTNGLMIIMITLFTSAVSAQNHGSREDREALFDYIYEKTLQREAFSPVKEQKLDFDPREAMLALKEEVINASDDVELYYALQKLSASRRDRHLSIRKIKGGLVLPEINTGVAPIRFHPDYSKKREYFLFVADLGKNINEHLKRSTVPRIGDRLIQVNGQPLKDYFNEARQYIRYSNTENLWRRFAYDLSEKGRQLPPSFYQDQLTLTLKNEAGKNYTITLPYLAKVDWQHGRTLKDYPGYELAWKKESFHLYTPTDPNNRSLLLWWYGFRRDLPEATDYLIEYAEKHNLLDHDLIIDAIDSRGGSQGAYALARLSPVPFKTTGGNLKLSDITDDFIARYTDRYVARQNAMDGSTREAQDDGTWVMEWLHGPVLKGLAAGQVYSNDVPFKCAHLPYYSDWIMQPAKKHFTGKMVVFLGPWGGSHLSQFAAMVVDNQLGYTIGMPDGGYSNTWEWEEDLVFPTTGKRVVQFMWNIGHTIRPNGQILEGNPVQVDEFIPVTSKNYLEYKTLLLEKALQWLNADKVNPLR